MAKNGIAVLVAVSLLCSALSAWAEEDSSPEKETERLIAHIDFSLWIPKSFRVSPDSAHVAYVTGANNKQRVVVDSRG